MKPTQSILEHLPSPTQGDYPFHIRNWGRCDYMTVFNAMQQFTEQRDEKTFDEVWLVEHDPVYTLGQRAILSDIIQTNHIPILHTNRGGRITYHGPGQLVIYPLLDLKRLYCHLRTLVSALENTLIQLLSDYHIKAYADPKAPGIYIDDFKIASLGLRIRKGCSYHGLAINVDMDLTPFKAIYPCGLHNTPVTQLIDWIDSISIAKTSELFLNYFKKQPLYY